MLIIALIFMVVNTIIVILVCNTDFILEGDKTFWNTKIILIINGLCIGFFFLTLKFLNKFTIKSLFLIFVITRILFLCFFIVFDYSVRFDFSYYSAIPNWNRGIWQLYPPMFIWWYSYNYWIYGLDILTWRLVNLLLEVGIVYAMIQIFHENSETEKGWNEGNFKIGLAFYIFSFTPIVTIILWGNMIAFPVLMGVLGFLYYFRSKKNPKYLYHSIFFFSIAALTEFFAAIWIFGILVIVLFQKEFKRLFILIGEILGIFLLVAFPFLIYDGFGYIEKLLSSFFTLLTFNWDGSIWAVNWGLLNLPQILSLIPTLLALVFSLYYLYKRYKSEISIDNFIVIICIFLFFSPGFSPWHYLWIFPLLCLNIIYSFRKFIITNLIFMSYFVFFILLFVVAYLTYPGPFYPLPIQNYVAIFWWMVPLGYFTILPLLIHTIYQMGLLYLIFVYTKSKRLVLSLLALFAVAYVFNFCFIINLVFT